MGKRLRLIPPTMLVAGLAWALIQPPMSPGGLVDPKAPIAKWKVAGRFATREACEQQRANNQGVILGALANSGNDDPGTRAALQIETASRCVQLPPAATPPPR